jgi:membrane complex biogenesis BtpA family protein
VVLVNNQQAVPKLWNPFRPIVGMVHLSALPGSVRYEQSLDVTIERALREAGRWVSAGADAIMVENFFDAPFALETVPPITVACLTRCASALRAAYPDIPLGINCLRNDGPAAVSIAHAVGAQFVRINVYVGAAVTDQGIVQGQARAVQLLKSQLGANIRVWSDVFVKHASQLGGADIRIEDHAKDAVYRGLSDGLIVSGAGTGFGVDTADIERVRAAVPGALIAIGSGYTPATAAALAAAGATAVIVGTGAKHGGDVTREVDAGLAMQCVDAWRLACSESK